MVGARYRVVVSARLYGARNAAIRVLREGVIVGG